MVHGLFFIVCHSFFVLFICLLCCCSCCCVFWLCLGWRGRGWWWWSPRRHHVDHKRTVSKQCPIDLVLWRSHFSADKPTLHVKEPCVISFLEKIIFYNICNHCAWNYYSKRISLWTMYPVMVGDEEGFFCLFMYIACSSGFFYNMYMYM